MFQIRMTELMANGSRRFVIGSLCHRDTNCACSVMQTSASESWHYSKNMNSIRKYRRGEKRPQKKEEKKRISNCFLITTQIEKANLLDHYQNNPEFPIFFIFVFVLNVFCFAQTSISGIIFLRELVLVVGERYVGVAPAINWICTR